MGVEATSAPRDVRTTLNYLQPQDEIPYYYVDWKPPVGVPARNARNEPHSVTIHNARGSQDVFGLDTSGFQWVNYPSAEKEFIDKERIKSVYYAEVESILKKHADAKRVFVFHHVVRRNLLPEMDVADSGPSTSRGPIVSVRSHGDYSRSCTGLALRTR